MSETIRFGQQGKAVEPQVVDAGKLSKEDCLEIIKNQSKVIEDIRTTMQQMHEEINRINMSNIFTRLEMLFRVVAYRQSFDGEFVEGCKAEIVDLMTIKRKRHDESGSK